MPTLIAYYKAATGWMGLISKTVVCLEVKPTPGVRPLIKKLGFFLSEACQLLKYNEYTTMCMGKVARYKEIVQAKILHRSLSLSESSTEIQTRLSLSLIPYSGYILRV